MSFLRQSYYDLKPFLPHRLRLLGRRRLAARTLRRSGDIWPINPAAGHPPKNWPGWPDGKKFALVLTHDVESQRGLDQCRALADLEESCGFRSSFNFIPEGDYSTPPELRNELTRRGFEVGVHDLYHDGKLYRSRSTFRKGAEQINQYLRDWNATGFRSGFMHHNLDWLHDLDIAYDMSTFDTDPFEPQPDGVNTIFPFVVPRPNSSALNDLNSSTLNFKPSTLNGSHHSTFEPSNFRTSERPPANLQPSTFNLQPGPAGPAGSHASPLSSSDLQPSTLNFKPSAAGYVELPYTLPQDSTLFLILRERTIAIWKQKLDWIARNGGMALLNTHPDYMQFDGAMESRTYVPELYREFLDYIHDRYSGEYWAALPNNIASYARSHAPAMEQAQEILSCKPRKKIWIDLDNTPHVPFFKPIITELEKRGHPVVVTSRKAFQVGELADKMGVKHTMIGRHYGKNPVAKLLGLFIRALEFLPLVLRAKPALAVSHGARSQILICNLLGIPTILLADYEHAKILPFLRPTWLYVPEVIPTEALKKCAKHVRQYPGIKEDVYVPGFRPSGQLQAQLNLNPSKIVVTVRPPANEAHYRSPESDALFEATMQRLTARNDTQIVLLPRNRKQLDSIKEFHPEWFKESQTIVPGPVDGLDLIWNSDLVISGGGTMNREAAALHVPVYSIFRGKAGAVDRHLSHTKRLIMLEECKHVESRLLLDKRQPNGNSVDLAGKALPFLVTEICRHASY